MANLKALRQRIQSIKATHKITSAMKMVATSKLRRLQDQTLQLRPYHEELQRVMPILTEALPAGWNPDLSPLVRGKGAYQNYLLIVLSSQRGLAGHFNMEVATHVMRRVEALEARGHRVSILCWGRKARSILTPLYGDRILNAPADLTEDLLAVDKPSWERAADLGVRLTAFYTSSDMDICQVMYTRFHSTLRQEVRLETLLPLDASQWNGTEWDDDLAPTKKGGELKALYEFEPGLVPLLNWVAPLYLTSTLVNALYNNAVSGEASRMMAMDAATRNAEKMLAQIRLVYNRTRQTSITREVTEIVSGAEALKG